jgi:hypothetical protein
MRNNQYFITAKNIKRGDMIIETKARYAGKRVAEVKEGRVNMRLTFEDRSFAAIRKDKAIMIEKPLGDDFSFVPTAEIIEANGERVVVEVTCATCEALQSSGRPNELCMTHAFQKERAREEWQKRNGIGTIERGVMYGETKQQYIVTLWKDGLVFEHRPFSSFQAALTWIIHNNYWYDGTPTSSFKKVKKELVTMPGCADCREARDMRADGWPCYCGVHEKTDEHYAMPLAKAAPACDDECTVCGKGFDVSPLRDDTAPKMTEEQIERAVERKIDRLDRKFMKSEMTQAEYDAAMREIHEWSEAQYAEAAPAKYTDCKLCELKIGAHTHKS